MNNINVSTAFIGGFLSFFSPCVLPLLPVYISLITGLSTTEIFQGGSKLRILFYTLIFIAGFSTVYLAMGAGSSLIGNIFFDYQSLWRIIGGLFLIIFGFLLIGLIKSGFFMRELRINIKFQKFSSPVGAFFIGIGFAAGWSPCIGPILGSILIYSTINNSILDGMKMLGAYSLGLAIPFLISSLAIDSAMRYLKKYIKIFQFINYFLGGVLIILGILMIFGLTF
jgi:cytochrome c-type biogenesis protein